MRRKSFLAMLLCLAMLLGILSGIPGQTVSAKAKDEILYYRGMEERYGYVEGYGTLFSYILQVDVKINRTKKTAEIAFDRTDYEIPDDLNEDDRAKAGAAMKIFKSKVSSDICRCKAEVTLDQFDSGNKTAFVLQNLVWTTEKFDIIGNGRGTTANILSINGWNKVTLGGLGKGHIGFETDGVPEKNDPGINILFKLLDGPPKKATGEYRIKHDNFKFVNTDLSFFKTGNTAASVKEKIFRGKKFAKGTGGFLLDDTSYEALIKGKDNSKVAAINVMLSGKWGGSCLGMSVMSGLLYEGKIGMKKVGGGDSVYSLKSPAKGNSKLSGYIEYYHLSGNFNRKRYYYLNKDNYPDSKDSAKQLVKMLTDNPKNPVVVGFHWNTQSGGKSVSHGHAVLAFKIDDIGSDYKVTVYDPNEPKQERYLYITDDGETSFAPYSSKITLQPPKTAKSLYNAKLVYPDIPEGYVVVRADGDTEVASGGKTAVITGDEITGDLEVYAEREEGSDEILILVPEGSDGVTIRRRGGKNASIETGDTTALITDGANELTMNPDGSVTAKTNGKKGSLAVASDKTKGKLFGITAQTDAGTIDITPANDGAHVKTDTGKTDITVSGAKDGVDFEGVDATGGVDVKIDGSKAKIYAGDKEIGSGEGDTGKGDDGKTDTKPKNPNLKIKKDNAKTSYTPDGWTPIDPTKQTVKYFIPGKYVRADGMAVLYIKSKKKGSFTFQLYQKAIGPDQDSYLISDRTRKDRFYKATIRNTTTGFDSEDNITFKARKNGSIKVTSDWTDELYMQYEAPDGVYYLVKEN